MARPLLTSYCSALGLSPVPPSSPVASSSLLSLPLLHLAPVTKLSRCTPSDFALVASFLVTSPFRESVVHCLTPWTRRRTTVAQVLLWTMPGTSQWINGLSLLMRGAGHICGRGCSAGKRRGGERGAWGTALQTSPRDGRGVVLVDEVA